MDHRAGGRRSHYDPRIGRAIIAQVLEGKTVREITADPDMPSYATVYQWVKVHPDFARRWDGAQRHRAWEKVQGAIDREAARRFWPAHIAKVEGRRWWRRGPRSSYSREVAEAFCAQVARGKTLTAITAMDGMPSFKVFYKWLRQEPEFRAMYVAARESWLFELRMRADDAADEALDCKTPAAFARVKRKVAKIEGRIGRMTAKRYREGCLD